MTPVEWYYAKGNRQNGPVGPNDLKQLADRGELAPDDLVWREGMDDWVAARKVKGLFDAEPLATPAAESPKGGTPRGIGTFETSAAAFERAREQSGRHLFDFLLEQSRLHFTDPFIDATARLFRLTGHYGLYVAMAAVLTFQIASGLKASPLVGVATGIVEVIALVVLQYAAARFFVPLDRLGRAETGRMASTAFLDSFALMNLALGVVGLVGFSIMAFELQAFGLVFPAIATFILCQYAAILALNPDALQITITFEAKAKEEAIALVGFSAKLLLKLVPVAFGLGILGGTIQLISNTVALFRAPAVKLSVDLSGDISLTDALTQLNQLYKGMLTQASGVSSVFVILAASALPVVAYVLFVSFSLLIDLARTFLDLPDKLDAMTKARANKEQGE